MHQHISECATCSGVLDELIAAKDALNHYYDAEIKVPNVDVAWTKQKEKAGVYSSRRRVGGNRGYFRFCCTRGTIAKYV